MKKDKCLKKSKELIVAIAAAKAAGKVIMKHYGKLHQIRVKSARLGIVTETDLLAQKKIKAVIRKSFPKAEFFAEEDKNHPKISHLTWVVDPLDGTTNFSRSIRTFTVSIALLRNHRPVIGVVFDPNSGELFYAEKGCGAFANGKRISVSNISKPEQGLFNIGIPRRAKTRKKNYAMLKKLFETMGGLRNFGTAALQLSLIAAGRVDAYLEYGLYAWDCAAGIVLIQEAGGRITDSKGGKYNMFAGEALVATNGKIHRQVIRELNK